MRPAIRVPNLICGFVDLLSKLLTSRPQIGLMADDLQEWEWLPDTSLMDMESMVGPAPRRNRPADTWPWLRPTLNLLKYPESAFDLFIEKMGIHAAAECVLLMLVKHDLVDEARELGIPAKAKTWRGLAQLKMAFNTSIGRASLSTIPERRRVTTPPPDEPAPAPPESEDLADDRRSVTSEMSSMAGNDGGGRCCPLGLTYTALIMERGGRGGQQPQRDSPAHPYARWQINNALHTATWHGRRQLRVRRICFFSTLQESTGQEGPTSQARQILGPKRTTARNSFALRAPRE